MSYIDYPSGLVPPDGMFGNSPVFIFSGSYVFNVFPDDPIVMQVYSGGLIRIFEGYNGTYLMDTYSGVVFTDGGDVWRTITNYAASLTQLETNHITVLFKQITSSTVQVYTQIVPETTSGWVLQTTISGTTISDSAGQPDQLVSSNLPILVGNSRVSTSSRIWRNDNLNIPLGVFSDSDTGIPQVTPTIARITELDAI